MLGVSSRWIRHLLNTKVVLAQPHSPIAPPETVYRSLVRPLLFQFDPERAHELTFGTLGLFRNAPGLAATLGGASPITHSRLSRQVFGLRFANPLGLAAGLDKNALLLPIWPALGFGFAEVGTITPRPQAGNPQPRLFRLPQDEALINRMGFNNDGMEAVGRRLEAFAKDRPEGFILGINIGKNKDTPNDRAVADYLACFHRLRAYADFFVVNVSSPNTPGLRALQDRDSLLGLLSELQNANQATGKPRPILLKIAPDLTDEQIDDVIDIVGQTFTVGVVATNTTISRTGLHATSAELERIGAGGLSGAPLRTRSTEVVRLLSAAGITVVGVGGISTPEHALEKLAAGAALVELYTGFIYEGPPLVGRILRAVLSQTSPKSR